MSEPIVQLQNVSVSYNVLAQLRVVLKQVDLTLSAGDWVMLRGENGSGKTTLVRTILHEIEPDSGQLKWGAAVVGNGAAVYALKQDPLDSCPLTLTVGEALWLADAAPPKRRQIARDKYQALLRSSELKIGVDAGTHSLSGGERQMVGLLMASLRPVRLLVLDEPTAALDSANEARCLALIARMATPSTAILQITHKPEHFERLGNRRCELVQGTIRELP